MHQLKAAVIAAGVGLGAAVLAAQSPAAPSTATSQPSTTSSSASRAQGTTSGERVTLTGCIERADQLTPTGASTPGATVDSQDFVLMKADESGATAAERPGTVGTAGSVGPLYRLVGDEGQLNPHVGQKVEVTGTRESTDAANAASQAANATNPTAARAPRLTVESIKVLADACPH
jgi:hypothetical protein